LIAAGFGPLLKSGLPRRAWRGIIWQKYSQLIGKNNVEALSAGALG